MTDDEMRAEFEIAFTAEVREAIVGSLRTAYRDARDRFQPSIGCDGMTFGLDVYKFACFRLGASPVLHVASTMGTFRLQAGTFLVGCYRVGHAEAAIEAQFPSNRRGAPRLIGTQLELFEQDPPDTVERPGVIIAHMGNHLEGLASVHLAVPAETDKDKICRWGYTELLWRSEEPTTAAPPQATLPPAELVEKAIVRRRSAQ